MTITISNDELQTILGQEPPDLPKYASFLINRANRWAQGTRPKVVGQLTDLIQQFDGRTLDEWKAWYLQRYPNAIATVVQRIAEMLENIKDALDKIDHDMIEQWVRDLVIVKTFIGLRCQEAILKKLTEMRGVGWRLATAEEEAQGIDGYIGDEPVSIKPETYDAESAVLEPIAVKIIRYRKVKSGIEVEFE